MVATRGRVAELGSSVDIQDPAGGSQSHKGVRGERSSAWAGAIAFNRSGGSVVIADSTELTRRASSPYLP